MTIMPRRPRAYGIPSGPRWRPTYVCSSLMTRAKERRRGLYEKADHSGQSPRPDWAVLDGRSDKPKVVNAF